MISRELKLARSILDTATREFIEDQNELTERAMILARDQYRDALLLYMKENHTLHECDENMRTL